MPNVVIIEAGAGGLCLAQGLRRAGVPVRVYERDIAPDARLQGYRLNIEPVGSRALHDCLPGQLWRLLVATAGDPGPGMGVFTHRLRRLMREPGETPDHPADGTHAVSRATLRRVLLAGLEDVVSFGKEFTRYSEDGAQVTAHFTDGTSAAGTLLVGADGARSRVRQQLLPHARVTPTGGFGVGGKLPLTDETARWLPPALTESKNMILPVGGIGGNMALGGARDLCHVLREAGTQNGAWLRPALAGCEQQMLKRGFGAVSASRRYLTLAISRNPAPRPVALGFFGLCGAVPPLRRAVFAD